MRLAQLLVMVGPFGRVSDSWKERGSRELSIGCSWVDKKGGIVGER